MFLKGFLLKITGLLLLASLGYYGVTQQQNNQPVQQEAFEDISSGPIKVNRKVKKTTLVKVDKGKNQVIEQNPNEEFLESAENFQLQEEVSEALGSLQEQIAQKVSEGQSLRGKQALSQKKKGEDLFTFSQSDLDELRVENSQQNTDGSEPSSINNRNSNSGLIGGIGRALDNQDEVIEEEEEESEETTTPEEAFAELPDVRGQARGFNMLYLMHPRARETVERQVEALEVSGIRDLYLSVLTDGTFAQDFNYLQTIIQRLNAVSDSLTLVLYVTNGPTMRDFGSPIIAGFNQIDPVRFRELIQFNQSVRDEYLGMVEQIRPIFQFNRSLNLRNRNIAIVMLEDNLTNAAYVSMRELTKQVLGEDLVEYYRKPCLSSRHRPK